jgi:general secretion pathway protein C
MKRPWILAMNVLLAAGAIALAGLAVAQVASGWLSEVAASGPPPAPPSLPAPKSFSDRSIVIGRNLFNADTLTPTAVDATESYEKSRLPLRLLATLAAGDASWAAFEDSGDRTNLVARVNEPLCKQSPYKACQYGNVILQRVERCRVVLENQNRREELLLEGLAVCAGGGSPSVARAAPPAPALARARGVRAPVQRLAENRFAVPRAEVESAAQNPAALYSQARILPRYENGAMVGVQLNAIRPGSLFSQVGIQDGDTVTQVNGVTVSTPEDGQRLLQEFSSGGELRVTVKGRDGQVRELEYVAQ